MLEQEIKKGNKLIAEFCGITTHNMFPEELSAPFGFEWMATSINCKYNWDKEIDNEMEFYKYFKFNSSWDWLMPVVEKIEMMGSNKFNDINTVLYSRFEIKHNHIKLYWSKDHKYQLFIEVIQKGNDSSSFGLSKKYIRINVTKETTKLEAVWLACVEFIKFYNLCQNKK